MVKWLKVFQIIVVHLFNFPPMDIQKVQEYQLVV